MFLGIMVSGFLDCKDLRFGGCKEFRFRVF
jgi:hypothetical protein